MKEIVRNLYENLLRLTGAKADSASAEFDELFPPVEVLSTEQIRELRLALGVEIDNPALYEQALTHRSYLQVLDSPGHRSNERLEFLGDSILGMITAEYLFYNHKQVLEGELTKMRSWLVNKNSLAVCARALELERFLFLSYSAQQSLQRGNEGMLADAMEAVIAAVYLDQGFDEARRFIVDKLLPIMVAESLVHDTNYKSLLLEAVQAKGYQAPRYVVAKETGPDHEKEFTVDVLVNGVVSGSGVGKSKKEAEQQAAKAALDSAQQLSQATLES